MNHSDLPWKCGEEAGIYDNKEIKICTMSYFHNPKNVFQVNERKTEANASFIVRACNNHERLIGALKLLTSKYGESEKISIKLGGEIGIYLSLKELEIFEQAIQSTEASK